MGAHAGAPITVGATRTGARRIGTSVLLGAACLALLPGRGVPAGEEPPSIQPLLTVHGPNDGEPLNHWFVLDLSVTAPAAARLYFLHGDRFLLMVPVDPAEGPGPRRIQAPFEATRFPNGPLEITILLLDVPRDRIVARASWKGRIDHPRIAAAGLDGDELRLELAGRYGDFAYVLLASREAGDLLKCPSDPTRKATMLATGFYAALPEEDAKASVVLNLDDFTGGQTVPGYLCLWSLDRSGKWSPSKVLSMAALVSDPAVSYRDDPDGEERRARSKG